MQTLSNVRKIAMSNVDEKVLQVEWKIGYTQAQNFRTKKTMNLGSDIPTDQHFLHPVWSEPTAKFFIGIKDEQVRRGIGHIPA
jgi:hypothetical protein